MSAVKEWEDVRCRQCGRLLLKLTRDALKSDKALEAKCNRCNALNYVLGRPEQTTEILEIQALA